MKHHRGSQRREAVPRPMPGPGTSFHPLVAGSGLGWVLLALLALLAAMPLMTGCEDEDSPVVVAADPPVPTGVFSVTGDGYVTIYWNDIYADNVLGYDVYRHDGFEPETGPYSYLGSVAWDENYDPDSLLHWFDDFDVENGSTYYYAVLSYDEYGNESELSFELVMDTPRPDGFDLVVYDRGGQPSLSGIDFYNLTQQLGGIRLPWNDPDADAYVEFVDGIPYVVAADEVLLQDYGTVPLDWAGYAPLDGYSATGRAELIAGHAYIFRVIDRNSSGQTEVHFAKFGVTAIGAGSVTVDWAYQVDAGNPELSVPVGTTVPGVGTAVVRF